MAKIALRFRETLRDISEQWCERNGVPPGYRLTFRRADGRLVRDDVRLHRRVLPKKAAGNITLKETLGELVAIFVTDVERRKWTLKLVGPDRKVVDGGNHMNTVRNMEQDSPTFHEAVDCRAEQDNKIEECFAQFEPVSSTLEIYDGQMAPEICRGALRALLTAHGKAAVRRAAEAEGLI